MPRNSTADLVQITDPHEVTAELRKIARDELGLEQPHLAAKGGEGLEVSHGDP
jgi:hypothetical protein